MVGATEGERLVPHLPTPLQWAQPSLTFFRFHCPTLYKEVSNQILYLKSSQPNIFKRNTGTWQIQNNTATHCIARQIFRSAPNGQHPTLPPRQSKYWNRVVFVRIVIFFQIHTRNFQFFPVFKFWSLIKICPVRRASAANVVTLNQFFTKISVLQGREDRDKWRAVVGTVMNFWVP
jgi:hypothetical protein